MSRALFPLDMLVHAIGTRILLPRLDAVEADGGPRERLDRRLVVALAALDLDHLRPSQGLILVQWEFIFFGPEAVEAGFVGPFEVRTRFQERCGILRLIVVRNLGADADGR